MNMEHLNDNELQMSIEQLLPDQLGHLENCWQCQTASANYQLMAEQLKLMEKPAFDFELAEQLIALLPPPKVPFPWLSAIIAGVGCVLILIIGLLFGNRIAILFSGLSSAWLYIMVLPGAMLVIMQVLAYWNEHARQMRKIIES